MDLTTARRFTTKVSTRMKIKLSAVSTGATDTFDWQAFRKAEVERTW
jgi:hypothetical protein